MPMTRALTVRIHGPMPQATLIRMRELLRLERRGRLTDAEDVRFGYRYVQHDDQNWIHLDLSRQDDTTWNFYLTYLNEPPSEYVVDQTLAGIRAAAGQLGLTVQDVIRSAPDALRDSDR
jgi:hypothetical protein